jgi:hypothetical protein
MIQSCIFGAGLGDVIRVIHLNASYQRISTPVNVVLASHNPFAIEIFRHHRNASNFILYELGHKYIEFLRAGLKGAEITRALMDFAGLPMESLIGGASDGSLPFFDAPDDIPSEGHVVFCPFAGSVGARTFTLNFTEKLVKVLRRLPVPVYIVTRSFPRSEPNGKIIHAGEDARMFAGGNIQIVDNLTVPASINLVRNASAYVGSWSSLHQAAWFENKPVAVFYPVNWGDVTKRTGYAFGLDRSDCYHSDFDSLDLGRFERWLQVHTACHAPLSVNHEHPSHSPSNLENSSRPPGVGPLHPKLQLHEPRVGASLLH